MSKPNEENAEAPSPPQTHNYSNIRLDDAAIAAIAETYPEDVREPVQWLAAFTRDQCARNLNVLVEKVRKLKFQSDYTYFYKIFCGKYFIVDGKRLGSTRNFVQIVDALRAEHRIAWRAGRIPFVETTIWEDIKAYIDKHRAPDRVCRFGGIVGPTGSQKTACFNEYCLRNNHGSCVHIESPERPRLAQFITDLAFAYGFPRQNHTGHKTNSIISALNEKKTIIVDNVQRLYSAKAGGDQPIFNFLQKIQDESGCTIILSYTPDFIRVLQQGVDRGYFEQFVGRMGGLRKVLRLPDYTPREDVLLIAQSFNLRHAEKHLAYLEAIAREEGRIRILFDDLQDAHLLAQEDKKPLTIEYLRIARGEEA